MTFNLKNLFLGLFLIIFLITTLTLIGVPVNNVGAVIIGAAIGLIFPWFE